jgi:hypothetical protein
MQRYPKELAEFVQFSMSDRSTVLKFIPIDNGIGQGDPPSMPYYTVFNAGLVAVAQGPNECAVAFVDDVVLLAIGTDFNATHHILQNRMTRPGGATQWADEHNSYFQN